MQDIHLILKKALAENTLKLNTQAEQQLLHYLQLLSTWNRVYNLTAITNPKEMVYLHLIDSLAVAPFIQGKHCLDVGTGAGLPGIPLAILSPQQSWVLLDKNSKKTRFLTQAIAELSLNNAKAMHARCEDFQPGHCFDSILSRAFGTLSMFAATTKHLLCDNGILIAMKGKYPQEELATIPEGFHILDVTRLTIKGTDIERHLVRLKRV